MSLSFFVVACPLAVGLISALFEEWFLEAQPVWFKEHSALVSGTLITLALMGLVVGLIMERRIRNGSFYEL